MTIPPSNIRSFSGVLFVTKDCAFCCQQHWMCATRQQRVKKRKRKKKLCQHNSLILSMSQLCVNLVSLRAVKIYTYTQFCARPARSLSRFLSTMPRDDVNRNKFCKYDITNLCFEWFKHLKSIFIGLMEFFLSAYTTQPWTFLFEMKKKMFFLFSFGCTHVRT